MKIAVLAKEKENIIDLSIGDPDLITDPAIIEAAYADVKKGATNYTAPDGSKEFLMTVVDFYQKNTGCTFNSIKFEDCWRIACHVFSHAGAP